MMASEWSKIRSFNGSQNYAFEELVCQLARSENIINGKKFIRLGTPDGGVEAFWVLENENEYGWQAKFVDKIEASQLSQIERSFKTAVKTHPKLVKYYICLPIDLPNSGLVNHISGLEKFNEKINSLINFAKSINRIIEIELWGNSELFGRLSHECNAGKYYFWFNKDELTDTWFDRRLKENIENLGKRYTPELNFEIEIEKIFDGLSRNESFKNYFADFLSDLKEKFNFFVSFLEEKRTKEKLKKIKHYQNEITNSIKLIDFNNCDKIEISSIVENIDRIFCELSILKDILNENKKIDIEYENILLLVENKDKIGDNLNNKENKIQSINYKYIEKVNEINNYKRILSKFNNFLSSNIFQLANLPILLLLGEAGKGKSHLLADVLSKRQNINIPSVFLLGQQFIIDEPWTQILKQLNLNCSKDEFLGAIDSKAQSIGQRIFFVIDAINEGDGKFFWEKYIAGFIKSFEHYKWIALVLSIRTEYEKLLIPKEKITDNKAVRVNHIGFEGKEYEASKLFFKNYEIQHPAVPLFIPEFSNPLFLKLFCEGLYKRGLHKIPEGYEGITNIIEFFINSVNWTLCKPEKLNYYEGINLVQKSINLLISKIAERNNHFINTEIINESLEVELRKCSNKSGLLKELISEGVFTKSLIWESENEYSEVIYLTYERFQDHLISKYLLDKYLDKKNPIKSFSETQNIYKLIKSERECSFNKGIVEAFSIQLPEIIGMELYEVAPHCKGYHEVIESFLNSILWRKKETINKKTLKYINEFVTNNDYFYKYFLDTILSVSSVPNHFYNADFIHKYLEKMSLPNRDYLWSIYLHNNYQYYEPSIIKRIIDWTWSEEKKEYLSAESIRLLSTTIIWFMTSSNRSIRDKATKAIIMILSNNLKILKSLVEIFYNINDPYVIERLMAVSLGCILNTTDKNEIKNFAQFIFDLVFKNGKPPVNILTRDYARELIEYALFRGCIIAGEMNKINPPYSSRFPDRIPTKEEIEKYYIDYKSENFKDYYWGQNNIYNSVMGLGDFARYVIGVNNDSFVFSTVNFHKKANYELFIKKLTVKKKRKFSILEKYYIYKNFNDEQRKTAILKFGNEEFEKLLKLIDKQYLKIKKEFENQLTVSEKKIFDNDVLSHLESLKKDKNGYQVRFDTSKIQRLIVKRIFELGWDIELFGEFDRSLNRNNYSGDANKPERIGKKYQWIAFYEYLARLSDNFEFIADFNENNNDKYKGTWQLHIRNIDPTISVKIDKVKSMDTDNNWWFNIKYNNWVNDNLIWLKKKNDLPVFSSIIEINDIQNDNWLLLEGYPHWREPNSIKDNKIRYPHKEIWTHLRSYIVKRSEKQNIINWLDKQNLYGRWMPESRDLHSLYNREYYWSKAYKYHLDPYYGYGEWENFSKSYGIKSNYKGIVTTETYMWGSGYDSSIEETIKLKKPSNYLFNLLGLVYGEKDNCLYDNSGNVICQDPSINNNGLSCLLVKKEILLNSLKRKNLDIIWTILGERLIYSLSPNDYLGRMEFSGCYSYFDNKIVGKIKEKYIGPQKNK